MRKFESGATRDDEEGKFDYKGFLSPMVLQSFAEYMHGHRQMADGTQRTSSNWKNGFPENVLLQSLLRHVMDLWLLDEAGESIRPEDGHEVSYHDALGGILFNVQALWLLYLEDGTI